MHKVTIQQQQLELKSAKNKPSERRRLNSKNGVELGVYDTNETQNETQTRSRGSGNKRNGPSRIVKKVTKSSLKQRRDSRKKLGGNAVDVMDLSESLPMKGGRHEHARRPSNLENYQRLKVQRNKEYSMQKKLHDQYIRDKDDIEKKKLKQFEQIDENNTSKVRANLNQQNQTIQDRLRSRRDKSVSRIRMKRDKLFQSHIEVTPEEKEETQNQMKHLSANLEKINGEEARQYQKKDTLAEILGKGQKVTSIEIESESVKNQVEKVEEVKIDDLMEEEVEEASKEPEGNEEGNIEEEKSEENGEDKEIDERNRLGSGDGFERTEVLLETQEIKVESIVNKVDPKKLVESVKPQVVEPPVEEEKVVVVESIADEETLKVAEKEDTSPEPKDADRQEANKKTEEIVSNTEEPVEPEEPTQEKHEEPTGSVEPPKTPEDKHEISQPPSDPESPKPEFQKKHSQSIPEGEDIMLTSDFSKQNSLEPTPSPPAPPTLPIKEEALPIKPLRPEHKKKNLSRRKIKKEKSKKNIRVSKKKLPPADAKKKKISHKKNKSEINFKSFQNGRKTGEGVKKKRKSMAAGSKNYSYMDKLHSQRKMMEKRQKKMGGRKGKTSEETKGDKLSKSNIVFPTPPVLPKKGGRSPPKKAKTGKKKIKSKKNTGLDKYLKGPKNVISKFKSPGK